MNVEMLEWINGWRNQVFLNYKSVRFIKALTLHKMINIITGSVESAVNHPPSKGWHYKKCYTDQKC